MLKLQINVKNKAEAQKIVALLGVVCDTEVKIAEYDGETWVFKDPAKTKYFLKKSYMDFESKEKVKIDNQSKTTL
jgi:hypothetical protein